jgi:hypothetical protein
MHIAGIWHPGLRIIEFGAKAGALGEALVRAGYQHYLGVARNQRAVARIAAAHPSLHSRLTVADVRSALRNNNGEVLILRGVLGLYLARFRRVRHAHYVALPLSASPAVLAACLLGLAQWLVGRLSRPTLLRLGHESQGTFYLVAFGVLRRRQPSARRHIPHTLGIERFLRRLNRQRVRYVVLRWFESLPALPPGEDLDLLVDDADLPGVSAMLDEGPGLQGVDLYSTTGLPGAEYRDMPYFPPRMAAAILDGARPNRDLCWVPSPEDHFQSLAYHALYHKGFDSGVPSRHARARRGKRPEHDYASILQKLARRLGVEVAIVLEDLDRYLDARGWRPPHDMLVRLARHNRWLGRVLGGSAARNEDAELAVFLVRQQALARGGLEQVAALVERHGFSVLRAEPIPPDRVDAVARSIRGGNWGRGPWPISGGPPAAVIVAYDPAPTAPSRRQRQRFPFLANARLLCKEKIRDALNAGVPAGQHCNTIHSSDNGREALDYLRVIMPEALDEMLARVEQLRREFQTSDVQAEPGALLPARGDGACGAEQVRAPGAAPVGSRSRVAHHAVLRRRTGLPAVQWQAAAARRGETGGCRARESLRCRLRDHRREH